MNIKKLAAAVGFALSLTAGAGQAGVLQFQDDDIDFVLDGTTLATKTSGAIVTGDIFVSIFEIPTITLDGVSIMPAGQELTGVAAIQVTVDGNNLTFAPVDTGLNSILALGTDPDKAVTEGGAGEGATIAMWFNAGDQTGIPSADNLVLDAAFLGGATNCDSLADCIFEGTRGSLFQVDGFAGDPDEFWNSQVNPGFVGNLSALLAANNTGNLALFNAAQTTFLQVGHTIGYINIATGAACPTGTAGSDVSGTAPLGCVAGPTLSGTIQGGQGLTNGAVAHSDFDAKKLTVPEPGMLLLLATGLLGVGGFLRRRG